MLLGGPWCVGAFLGRLGFRGSAESESPPVAMREPHPEERPRRRIVWEELPIAGSGHCAANGPAAAPTTSSIRSKKKMRARVFRGSSGATRFLGYGVLTEFLEGRILSTQMPQLNHSSFVVEPQVRVMCALVRLLVLGSTDGEWNRVAQRLSMSNLAQRFCALWVTERQVHTDWRIRLSGWFSAVAGVAG